MGYTIELFAPTHETRTVALDELPDEYAALKQANSPTVSWESPDDSEVVIVSVGEDYSVVTLKAEETWYWLQTSDDDEPVEVDMGGTEGSVPRGAIAPRETGLEVLKNADDFAKLRTEHTWVEQ